MRSFAFRRHPTTRTYRAISASAELAIISYRCLSVYTAPVNPCNQHLGTTTTTTMMMVMNDAWFVCLCVCVSQRSRCCDKKSCGNRNETPSDPVVIDRSVVPLTTFSCTTTEHPPCDRRTDGQTDT